MDQVKLVEISRPSRKTVLVPTNHWRFDGHQNKKARAVSKHHDLADLEEHIIDRKKCYTG